MTGIEQLRKLGADAVRGGDIGRAIWDIADQIERERECERDTIENLRLELGEARDDAAWVREHGGLESVKERLDWVVGHCSTKQQLDFDFWLSGRVMHELGFDEDMADRDEVERRLLARLMPEGFEWPRFEDGARLAFEDELPDFARTIYKTVKTVKFQADGTAALTNGGGSANVVVVVRPGERVKRPAPKVLAGDNEPLYRGEYVWHEDGTKLMVLDFLHEEDDETIVKVSRVSGPTNWSECRSLSLTHERPDSWKRIEEDAGCTATKYNERRGTIFTTKQQVARDLVRRCRALAERERGES